MLTGRMIAGMQLSQNTKIDKLAAIDLSDVEAEHLIPFLKKCKVLNLNGSIRLTSDILEKLLFEIPDDIGELHLASTALTDNCLKILSGKVSHCKKLNFNNCTQITTPALKNFILELPNDIKEVYFYKTNLLNECAIKLLPKLAHCTRFNLNNLIHISPWILGNLLKKLPEMTELYLGCTQMKDEAALVLPPKMGKCMRLNINNWEDISSQILSQIIESLPEDIQEIYLKNTQLTDDIAEKLAPKLKECSGLNISDCKQLSEKGLEIILKNLDPNINWLGISGLKKQFEQIKNKELMEKFSKWITS